MIKTLNRVGYFLATIGLILTLCAAGMSDVGVPEMKGVIVRLVAGLFLLGVGALTVKVSNILKEE
jgi:hypothetical protein